MSTFGDDEVAADRAFEDAKERACSECGHDPCIDPQRPDYIPEGAVDVGPIMVAFDSFFDALEDGDRVKDTKEFIIEVLVGQLFKDPDEFWEYVNGFEREW